MTVSRRNVVKGAAMGTLAVAAGAPGPALAAPRALPAPQAPDTIAQIDAIVARFMATFEIPGVAVAIVTPGAAPVLRPYGVRKLGDPAPVDVHTRFAIASNSKAFLTACLAILVDEGKLAWDDPVTRYLPEFEMFDPAVTAMMTVRDLLVHRSGLALGAGDLMQFPPTDHTAEDMLHALRFLKPATPFRAAYAYDNILYIVAGILLKRVSGLGWDAFVAQRIFAPLGMAGAVSNTTLLTGSNRAARHARLGPPTRGVGQLEVVAPAESAVIGPAGGICASVADIMPWLQVQLGRGVGTDGTRLWSVAQANEMWKAQTIISSGPGPSAEHPERSVLSAYALGWGVADYRGCRMLSHAGGVAGQVTRTTLLPDRGIGFVVFTNCEDGDAVSALRYAILDILLQTEPAFDWIAPTRQLRTTQLAQVAQVVGRGDFAAPPGVPSQPLDHYTGRYRDPWYGDVLIERNGMGLTIDFTHTPTLKGRLEPFGPDAFRTRFPRGAGEDAVLHFDMQGGAVAALSMRALSPLADPSFDFQDLHLAPVAR